LIENLFLLYIFWDVLIGIIKIWRNITVLAFLYNRLFLSFFGHYWNVY